MDPHSQIVTSTPPQLEALFHRRGDEPFTVTAVTLTPAEARYIVEMMGYPRQRGISQTHVDTLADVMLHDVFVEGPEIVFAPMEAGVMVAVDGQHRLAAAVKADQTRGWSVKVVFSQTAEQVYPALDRHMKARTRADVARAIGYEMLSEKMKAIVLTAAFHQLNWDVEYQIPRPARRVPDRDCQLRVNDQIQAILTYETLLNNSRATREIRSRIASARVAAIIIETLHAVPNQAQEFWSDVITNGEEIAGALRAGLIAGKPLRAGASYLPKLTALGWNQRNSTAPFRRESRRPVRLDETNLLVT